MFKVDINIRRNLSKLVLKIKRPFLREKDREEEIYNQSISVKKVYPRRSPKEVDGSWQRGIE